MNCKKAKAIRKKVFGSKDFRKRKYTETPMKRIQYPDGNVVTITTRTADTLRTLYQKMKRVS